MMRMWSCIVGVILVLASIPQASAGASGPACVIDGNTLMVNGRRWYGKCTGGTEVRLFGIIAPDLSQLCDAPGGRKWQCGRASATMLLEAVKTKDVTCKGASTDADGRLMADCHVEGQDLNRKMVRDGWALAYPRHSMKYLPDERIAKQNHKGLWQASQRDDFPWRNR